MKMKWQVFKVGTTDRFLTSDNPVFIGRSTGLKPPSGEFLFALASDIALVGNWEPSLGELTYLSANSRVVKEFNRFIVSAAENWIYFHKKAGWLKKVVQNPSTKVGRPAK